MFSILFFGFFQVYAAFEIKPGLWEVQSTIEANGKKMNPQEELNKALAQIPEAQKKQMMQMIQQNTKGNNLSTFLDASKMCITKEMVQKGLMPNKEKSDCDFKVKTNTSKKLIGSFACQDGSKGDVDWTAITNKEYKGSIKGSDGSGKKITLDYQAKFIKEKCDQP